MDRFHDCDFYPGADEDGMTPEAWEEQEEMMREALEEDDEDWL
jgi:hypothetical protein